ncbi:MAG: nucleoside-diphosphate kinase [Steroidobacteraceae bacterium]
MALERTFSIVKPDGVARDLIGQVYTRFESAGLKVVASKLTQLSQAQAEGFYAVHKARPFFNDLVKYMTSGPVVLQVLEGENAVLKNREIMGATDPKKAAPGTIRADLAQSIEANTVHGSDSVENAAIEIAYFFAQTEIHSR